MNIFFTKQPYQLHIMFHDFWYIRRTSSMTINVTINKYIVTCVTKNYFQRKTVQHYKKNAYTIWASDSSYSNYSFSCNYFVMWTSWSKPLLSFLENNTFITVGYVFILSISLQLTYRWANKNVLTLIGFLLQLVYIECEKIYIIRKDIYSTLFWCIIH